MRQRWLSSPWLWLHCLGHLSSATLRHRQVLLLLSQWPQPPTRFVGDGNNSFMDAISGKPKLGDRLIWSPFHLLCHTEWGRRNPFAPGLARWIHSRGGLGSCESHLTSMAATTTMALWLSAFELLSFLCGIHSAFGSMVTSTGASPAVGIHRRWCQGPRLLTLIQQLLHLLVLPFAFLHWDFSIFGKENMQEFVLNLNTDCYVQCSLCRALFVMNVIDLFFCEM